jgi:hypothetical protein
MIKSKPYGLYKAYDPKKTRQKTAAAFAQAGVAGILAFSLLTALSKGIEGWPHEWNLEIALALVMFFNAGAKATWDYFKHGD